MTAAHAPPMPAVARAEARGAVYRLAAAALGYPLAETQQAFADGRFHQSLDDAWQLLSGEPWPRLTPSASLTDLEVGYMATFVHGDKGKPRVPLVANAYPDLLAGLSPGSYLLNVQAFYRHFGLTAALGDEGLADEPDHLVAMLEFCALLCHLERRALAGDADVAPYRRAQRDFLTRCLGPLLHAVRDSYARQRDLGLDATLEHLIKTLPDWADRQCRALEAEVGPCPDPASSKATPDTASQPLWD
ncbi:molecular chaperone TorD family protein [Halomonas sp. CS7]|uniref:Molecular chaperone TorD family protein n=1 Tax=Halomonas pelophila TaxID=3151122 RepID=A0ABV1N3V6_9GAMM